MRTGGSSAEPTHTHTLTAHPTPPIPVRPHRTHTGSFHLQVDRLLLQQLTRPVARAKVNQLRWHSTTRTPGQQALILVLGEQHQCLRVGVLGKTQSCMTCAVMRGGCGRVHVSRFRCYLKAARAVTRTITLITSTPTPSTHHHYSRHLPCRNVRPPGRAMMRE